MACLRYRAPYWVVDWRDALKVRHNKKFHTREEAEQFFPVAVAQSRKMSATVGRYMTVAEYAPIWLQTLRGIAASTRVTFEGTCRLHIIPLLGAKRIGELEPYHVGQWYAQLKGTVGTVTLRKAVLSMMLSQAVRDGLIQSNPAATIRSRRQPRKLEAPKAMTSEQLASFLDAAKGGSFYHQFFVLAHTGLRPGEGRGLQVEDLDFDRRVIKVRRQVLQSGEIAPPKTLAGVRDVDMAEEVATRLRELLLRSGGSPWVMHPELGRDPTRTRRKGITINGHLSRAMAAALETAQLQAHFTPHCLRHTFATQLLLLGKPATYVQYQLGHASIQETVDTYGSWLPKSDRAAVNDLAKLVGSGRQMSLS